MKKPRLTAKSRSHLDRRFLLLGPPSRFSPPPRGWIRAIRESLGITTAQLAKRLRVSQPSIVDLEHSEARGSIELATLRRAAQALNCSVIYALVPNQPLDTMIRDRARAFVRRRMDPVEHSMLLEDQSVAPSDADAGLDEILRETNPRLFWD